MKEEHGEVQPRLVVDNSVCPAQHLKCIVTWTQYEKTLEPEHPNTSTSPGNLALVILGLRGAISTRADIQSYSLD